MRFSLAATGSTKTPFFPTNFISRPHMLPSVSFFHDFLLTSGPSGVKTPTSGGQRGTWKEKETLFLPFARHPRISYGKTKCVQGEKRSRMCVPAVMMTKAPPLTGTTSKMLLFLFFWGSGLRTHELGRCLRRRLVFPTPFPSPPLFIFPKLRFTH